jgi:hypothetical protein
VVPSPRFGGKTAPAQKLPFFEYPCLISHLNVVVWACARRVGACSLKFKGMDNGESVSRWGNSVEP